MTAGCAANNLLWGRIDRGRWRSWLRDRVAMRGPVEWLQVHPADWVLEVEAALGGRAERFTRVNFTFDREAYARGRTGAADHARIVPTTVEMFSRIDGSVVPKRFWRDGAQFARAGGGFSAILAGSAAEGRRGSIGDEIVASAFCSFRHGARLEIGIETVARHRGHGYARLVACALIDDCLQRGLEPVWACRQDNAASFQLARRLGFVPGRQLPCYRIHGDRAAATAPCGAG